MNPAAGAASKRWHLGFRCWFGGTYYLSPIDTPEKARQAVAETWARWLHLAKLNLLPSVANKVERHAGADALPVGELASVPARIPVGERASD